MPCNSSLSSTTFKPDISRLRDLLDLVKSFLIADDWQDASKHVSLDFELPLSYVECCIPTALRDP